MGLGSGFLGSRSWVLSSGFLGFWVPGFWVLGSGFWALGSGLWVSGFWFLVSGSALFWFLGSGHNEGLKCFKSSPKGQGLHVLGSGRWALISGFWVLGFGLLGFWVLGF